jgi:hypothetical protein
MSIESISRPQNQPYQKVTTFEQKTGEGLSWNSLISSIEAKIARGYRIEGELPSESLMNAVYSILEASQKHLQQLQQSARSLLSRSPLLRSEIEQTWANSVARILQSTQREIEQILTSA